VAKESLDNVYEIENILNNLLLMSGMTKLESSHKQRVDELVWKIYENWNLKQRKNSGLKYSCRLQNHLLEFPE
jgi:redox-regulated HSP33 family molecular chaperone